MLVHCIRRAQHSWIYYFLLKSWRISTTDGFFLLLSTEVVSQRVFCCYLNDVACGKGYLWIPTHWLLSMVGCIDFGCGSLALLFDLYFYIYFWNCFSNGWLNVFLGAYFRGNIIITISSRYTQTIVIAIRNWKNPSGHYKNMDRRNSWWWWKITFYTERVLCHVIVNWLEGKSRMTMIFEVSGNVGIIALLYRTN